MDTLLPCAGGQSGFRQASGKAGILPGGETFLVVWQEKIDRKIACKSTKVVVKSECCQEEDGPLLPKAHVALHRVLRTSTTLKEAHYE
jgi:hypothetical protein